MRSRTDSNRYGRTNINSAFARVHRRFPGAGRCRRHDVVRTLHGSCALQPRCRLLRNAPTADRTRSGHGFLHRHFLGPVVRRTCRGCLRRFARAEVAGGLRVRRNWDGSGWRRCQRAFRRAGPGKARSTRCGASVRQHPKHRTRTISRDPAGIGCLFKRTVRCPALSPADPSGGALEGGRRCAQIRRPPRGPDARAFA